MRERTGKSKTEIQAVRESHERYWEEAASFAEEQAKTESIVAHGVERSRGVISRLWERGGTYE